VDGVAALDDLLRKYWQPVYVYFRSRAGSIHDAEDLTQGFFETLISSRGLEKADRERGRLRSFLITQAKRFQIDEWRKSAARKRGGDLVQVPLDTASVEAFFFSGTQVLSDELLYDRSWAYAVLAAVSESLLARYEESGKLQLYHAIKGCLEGDGKYQAGAELADELEMTPEALRSAVFRLRRQFRECLTAEVQKTCDHEDEVHEEIAFLCRILAE
jgi:RNA polymerase sigma-70 factor (ECF subfamily)